MDLRNTRMSSRMGLLLSSKTVSSRPRSCTNATPSRAHLHPSLWLSESHDLLITESDDGVDFCGATSWHKTGQQGHESQQHGTEEEGQGIRGSNAVEQTGHPACERDRGHGANRGACQSHENSSSQHEAEDVALLRSERETDANLVDALADGISHYTVNANRREHQRETRKEHQQQHGKAAVTQCAGDDFIHRPRRVYRDLGVHRANDLRNGFREPARVVHTEASTKNEGEIEYRTLQSRGVHERKGFGIESEVLDISHDPDNQEPWRRPGKRRSSGRHLKVLPHRV